MSETYFIKIRIYLIRRTISDPDNLFIFLTDSTTLPPSLLALLLLCPYLLTQVLEFINSLCILMEWTWTLDKTTFSGQCGYNLSVRYL